MHAVAIISIILIIALVVIFAASRDKGGPSSTVPALTLPGAEPVRDMEGIKYLLHHDRATSGGIAALPNNSVRVSGWMNIGALRGSGGHCSINLRNDVSLRDWDRLPAGPYAPTTGVGIIIGDIGSGQPDFPEEGVPVVLSACVERFVKDQPPTLYPDTHSPALPDRVWVSVASQRVGNECSVAYLIAGEGVRYEAPDAVIERSTPLTGDDLTRALFPNVGGVTYEDMRCEWSAHTLLPLEMPSAQIDAPTPMNQGDV